MGRLDGKVALITGVGPNSGGTTGVLMAKEGAKIVCNDIVPAIAEETAEIIHSKGGEAIHTAGDVSDEKHIKAMVKAGVDAFGHIDTLINLPAFHEFGSVLDFKLETWNREVAIVLTAPAMVMKEVANQMVAKGRRGSIINISSDAGVAGQPHRMGYSAVKAGLVNMTRAVAMELAHLGIRVNAICPSGMEHNLWRTQTMPVPQPRTRWDTTLQDTLDAIPIGRFMRSIDLAYLAVYLASDESEAITGVSFPLDGGATAAYNSWVPGRYTKVSVEEYIKTTALYQQYGETVQGPGVDLGRITFRDEQYRT